MSDQVLKVVVRKREEQGDGVVVLDLVSPQGRPLPSFEAGAHIDVHLKPGLVRQYSLCGDPANVDAYRLGVLKDPDSRGGSLAVHALLEGREIEISTPRNHFPLAPNARRSILIGGGIGITPMVAMAYALNARDSDFELHYCARSRSRSAFLDELGSAGFAACLHTHFDDEEEAQKLDLASLLGNPQADVHVYVCGPAGFMDWVIGQALAQGYADDHVHREYFQVAVDASGASFEVHAARSGKTVQVAQGQSIVEALRTVGINIEVSCAQGVCGTCLCDVLEGEPDHRDVYLTDDEKSANDQILVCCSRARSNKLVLDI
ncbi:2Fe-2S iron-sulfur cluster binding domain-containing protein [Pseudomonas sp. Fl5BN2]|uniref:PDR/VanB family oxidoreductase n=1 Tax=unclassified Pseudomonas TaxID=196821 RepID=UPI0013772BC3|nr:MULTISPECIES: PDR/VanB family oxidoreductase [unclassified Pseudomonas]NBF04642.1 2Fe-2S iron-sulfur cluster binding domain-containing protein [Pseudomonas sp. Fl5BN2]NBF12536.1 2Fe-2S iron-sulfur cluster binding domain-containing protein [Pseudomonas sp. Fl4BN1]